MEAFLLSTSLVALAEIGDKTQLLAFALAAKFRRPWPIIGGILLATVVNHAFAAALGAWVANLLGPQTLRWVLALSFLAMAVWMMVPDKLDEEDAATPALGVFAATTIAFFLAEMGDKTQLATVALAAQFNALLAVVLGTTLGMMLANVPAVLVGGRLGARLPLRLIHGLAAMILFGLGLATAFGAGERFGF